ncbi:MAG: riboflavin biosynthesis protein RibD [Planctomycetes bacterium GWF2_41_51]|nr:MAG: riboflavin biosynthesis protein RibD [Planctomycetes bacterium GWF2_41_51]
MTVDVKFMETALSLAKKGLGSVEPNPAVGCVIVKDGKIIGKGYHKKFGGPHAEIEALKNCKTSTKGASLYVTLEPCCHFGKTPPCTDAVIKAKIKKVVAAVKDPTKKVAGKGFKILRKAGIEVVSGICQKEAKNLNAPFLKFAKTRKPYVIVKWAQSKDGFLCRTDKKRWITNAASRRDVHKLRKRAQAILVGINTVLEDDPMLTIRPDTGRRPLRVVLDSKLQIPLNCNLIQTANETPVCIFTASKKKINLKGVEIIKVSKNKNRLNLKAVLAELGKRNIQQLLVEGGEKIITSFIRQNLADEIIVYTSNEYLGKKGKITTSPNMKNIYNRLKHNSECKKIFGTDVRLRGIVNEKNRNFRIGNDT